MSNRSVREGVVRTGHEARVVGTDKLVMRALMFPEGIIRCALGMAGTERYCMGALAGIARYSSRDAFGTLNA